MSNTSRPDRCPKCESSSVARILYGLPGDLEALQPDMDAGRIVLGGCVVTDHSPQWRCKACGHEWSSPERMEAMREFALDIVLKRETEEKREEESAIARGVMDAHVNMHGWTKCPYCGMRFSTRQAMSWDGEKHTTCKTRLRLVCSETNDDA